MESFRMDYRFTAILIVVLCSLAFFADPAYPSYENIVELINGR